MAKVKFCQRFQGNSPHVEFLEACTDNHKAMSIGLDFWFCLFVFSGTPENLSHLSLNTSSQGRRTSQPHRTSQAKGKVCATSKYTAPDQGTHFYQTAGAVLSHLQFVAHLNHSVPRRALS